MNADAVELRVLGCLIEKQRTTPDVYPLSLNALRLACNQSTNREPVVDYDEPAIRDALQRLSSRGWVRLASGPTSRAVKYRHLFDEALGLSDSEISLLTVLMLRGAQTVGELKSRSERLHRFDSLAEVDESLHALAGVSSWCDSSVVRVRRKNGGSTAWERPPTPPLLTHRRARSRNASVCSRCRSRSCESRSGGRRETGRRFHARDVSRHVVRCSNCGGEAPPDARFCPRCGAPLPADVAPIELRRPRWERLLFATVAVLLVASVVVTVLVIVFGVFVESPGA